MNIGLALKTLRERAGLTQYQAAKELGVAQNVISRLENNNLYPSSEMAPKLSKLYKIPIPILFFMALDEDDIADDDLEYYREYRPNVDAWVEELFVK